MYVCNTRVAMLIPRFPISHSVHIIHLHLRTQFGPMTTYLDIMLDPVNESEHNSIFLVLILNRNFLKYQLPF